MATIDPLSLKKVQELLDDMDSQTRAYVEAMIPAYWQMVENNIDALLNLVEGQMSYASKTFSELIDLLRASNAGSDAAHIVTEENKQKARDFFRQIILLFVVTQLGE